MKSETEKILRILSKNICTLRKEKGWTQEQLADKSELSTRTVNNIENCITCASLDVIVPIATALGVSLPELFCDTNNAESVIDNTKLAILKELKNFENKVRHVLKV